MKKVLAILALLTFGFVIGYFYCASDSLDRSFEPICKYYEIYFYPLNKSVYIKTKVWGLLGNHSSITISTDNSSLKEWVYSTDKAFEFNTDQLFYRIQGKDSLVIYTNSSTDFPSSFNGELKIVPELKQGKKCTLEDCNKIEAY